MDNIENIIWDTITKSAKKRFDYSAFEKQLDSPDEIIIDGIVFIIIDEFAKGESKKHVVTKVLQRALLKGLKWNEFDIIRFVNNTEHQFKVEIYTANVVYQMLKDHKDIKEVLTTVNKMLN
ncbi:MAG: hypothetical protein JEZ09_02330 [Salinivirgaceae bacterium]|nr:hypothetical protein [Salinivirgaceae bacterium]